MYIYIYIIYTMKYVWKNKHSIKFQSFWLPYNLDLEKLAGSYGFPTQHINPSSSSAHLLPRNC